MRGELLVDEYVTHTAKLEDINHSFDLMRQGKSIRSVLKMHDD